MLSGRVYSLEVIVAFGRWFIPKSGYLYVTSDLIALLLVSQSVTFFFSFYIIIIMPLNWMRIEIFFINSIHPCPSINGFWFIIIFTRFEFEVNVIRVRKCALLSSIFPWITIFKEILRNCIFPNVKQYYLIFRN